MERNFIYESDSLDGYRNLAVDEWFLDHVGDRDLILHFYQNKNAVIIGKNQNPWVECDLIKMKTDGVQLVRRVSGGGAVYHDEGNLNFSFIAGKDRFDQEAFLSLVLNAVKETGVEVCFSGRNDMLLCGKKFSGTALAHRKGKSQFHGTLLVSADLDKLDRYLTVDAEKIRSKGIDSVRSRVCNLSEAVPELTVKALRKSLVRQMEENFGYWAEWSFSPREKELLASYEARHASDEWRLGTTPPFDFEWKRRFSWGGVRLLLSLKNAVISKVTVFTDGMDPSLPEHLEELLKGVSFSEGLVKAALLSSPREDVRQMGEAFSL